MAARIRHACWIDRFGKLQKLSDVAHPFICREGVGCVCVCGVGGGTTQALHLKHTDSLTVTEDITASPSQIPVCLSFHQCLSLSSMLVLPRHAASRSEITWSFSAAV